MLGTNDPAWSRRSVAAAFGILILVTTASASAQVDPSAIVDPRVSTGRWVDAPRDEIRYSEFFSRLRYGDAVHDNTDLFWPYNVGDGALPDSMAGPSEADLEVLPDPSGLYYKHLSPFPLPSASPSVLNPRDSMSSVVVGLEGGPTGVGVRTVTLFIHPALEQPLIDQVGIDGRVEAIAQPFLEGAVGHDVPFEVARALYMFAMTQDRGLIVPLDDTYVAAIQNWFDRDSSIHVVRDLRQ